jgi:hypothetical protein
MIGSNHPRIVGVFGLGDGMLRLEFDDGTVGDVDFSNENWAGVLEPLCDPASLARVYVDSVSGTLTWPGGLDIAPEPLYEQAVANPSASP